MPTVETVTIVNVYPFKGFFDSHVNLYHDELAFLADPLGYAEDQDYQAGKLLNCQADWDADYIAGQEPPDWAQ